MIVWGKEEITVTGNTGAVTALVRSHRSHLWHHCHSLGGKEGLHKSLQLPFMAAIISCREKNIFKGCLLIYIVLEVQSKGGWGLVGGWISYCVDFTLMYCMVCECFLPRWFYEISILSGLCQCVSITAQKGKSVDIS